MVSAEEERLLAMEVEKRFWGDIKMNDNVIVCWFMIVKYFVLILSFENVFVYVVMILFRMVFWSLVYVLRVVFWIVIGRSGVFVRVLGCVK